MKIEASPELPAKLQPAMHGYRTFFLPFIRYFQQFLFLVFPNQDCTRSNDTQTRLVNDPAEEIREFR